MPDEFTPDFSLTKPETLTREDYHRAMDRIDGLLVGRGPVSDRPSDPTDEMLWVDTNTGTIDWFDADEGEWGGGEFSPPVSRTDARTVEIRVPTEFDTITEALDEIREIRTPPGVHFDILVESGHEMVEPIFTREEDLRHVELKSESDTIPVSDDFPSDENILEIFASAGPVLDTKIDCRGNGDYGVRVTAGGFYIGNGHTGVGVINAADNGINASNAATVMAYRNDFSGAGNHGAEISRGSIATFGRGYGEGPADFSGAANDGLHVDRGGFVRAEDANITDVGNHAVDVSRASTVTINDADLSNPGNAYIRADNGSTVEARGVDCYGASGDPGVLVTQLAAADLSWLSMEGSPGHGVAANNGGRVYLRDADIIGSSDWDISCTNGSIVTANGCETTNSTGSDPHHSDVRFHGMHTTHGLIFGEQEGLDGETGVYIELNDHQTVPGDDSETRIEFDDREYDDFDGLDTTTGIYTIPNNGVWKIEGQVRWDEPFGDPASVRTSIHAGGSEEATTRNETLGDGIVTTRTSITKRLSTGDEVYLTAQQDSGSSNGVVPWGAESFLSIHRIGR